MKKKIDFKRATDLRITQKPSNLKEVQKKLDEWVTNSSESKENLPQETQNSLKKNSKKEKSPETENDMYRFTIILPRYLHKRIKKTCAADGITMTEKLIEIFKEKFPEA